ncbi:hypothetical protein B0T17DRAFT_371931 [Bombardia bombarda]|uniref:Uncharacterized protein n=1 Tax=Bombardia bombarda TaxID=252184 RepID=A0AA40BV80_9PEZI|nr:hypothetical protein B0T17DRAFT_371931 [Bombardia bombarda]
MRRMILDCLSPSRAHQTESPRKLPRCLGHYCLLLPVSFQFLRRFLPPLNAGVPRSPCLKGHSSTTIAGVSSRVAVGSADAQIFNNAALIPEDCSTSPNRPDWTPQLYLSETTSTFDSQHSSAGSLRLSAKWPTTRRRSLLRSYNSNVPR